MLLFIWPMLELILELSLFSVRMAVLLAVEIDPSVAVRLFFMSAMFFAVLSSGTFCLSSVGVIRFST